MVPRPLLLHHALRLAPQGEYHPSLAAVVAVLAQIDALPRAEAQPAAGNGDQQAAAQQRRLDVGRHVVGPFDRVLVRELFRHDGRQAGLEVHGHVGVGVLVDRQRGRRVLQEDVQQADLVLGQLGQSLHDLACHEMEPSRVGRKLERALDPGHGQLSSGNFS